MWSFFSVLLLLLCSHKVFPTRDSSFSSNKSQVIPRNVFLFWHSMDLPDLMRKNVDRMIDENPEFQFELFDEHKSRQFIVENFDKSVVDAFDTLLPDAFKCDLWRYCILYIRGGIYIDIKYRMVNGSKLINFSDREYFVLERPFIPAKKVFPNESLSYEEEFRMINQKNYYDQMKFILDDQWPEGRIGVFNGLIIVKPKNMIMMNTIQRIVKNVASRYYGDRPTAVTGPIALGEEYFKFYNDDKEHKNWDSFELFFTINDSADYITSKKSHIVQFYSEYRREEAHSQKHAYYADMWRNQQIYRQLNDITNIPSNKPVIPPILTSEVCKPLPRPRLFGDYPTKDTIKIIGTGLSKTATTSLADFFVCMGLKVVHYDQRVVTFLQHSQVNWHLLYDDYDAVFDLPTAIYYEELLNTYPSNSLFISFFREPESWFRSFNNYLDITRSLHSNYDPFYQTALQKLVYGSEQPNHDLWIAKYLSHYNSVRRSIPRHRLLDLHMREVRNSSIHLTICEFLGITTSICPEFPHVNIGEDVLIWPIQYFLDNIEVKAMSNHKYAYVTSLEDPAFEKNEKKNNVIEAALVWCFSIKQTYKSIPHLLDSIDWVVLVWGYIETTDLLLLYQCFDRIIPVAQGKARGNPSGFKASRETFASHIKLFSFNLTDYTRVQYFSPNAIVIRNIDYYFFRDIYEKNLRRSIPRVLTHLSDAVPVSTSYFSIEPNAQDLVDLFSLFIGGDFNYTTGWMHVGKFTFVPKFLSIDNEFIGNTKRDEDFPFLPLTSHLSMNSLLWIDSNWTFPNAMSDNGVMFYLFFIYHSNDIGLNIHPDQFDHEVIRFIGKKKPWMQSHEIPENGWKQAVMLYNSIKDTFYQSLQVFNESKKNMLESRAKLIYDYLTSN